MKGRHTRRPAAIEAPRKADTPGDDAPTVAVGIVETILHFGVGAYDLPDPDGPPGTTRRHYLVALTVSTPVGVNTYMIEPAQAHTAATQIMEVAARCHLENLGPEGLQAELDAEQSARP